MKLSNEQLTVRTLTTLRHLKIETVEELKSAILPSVGTVINRCIISGNFVYSQRVDTEIRAYLESFQTTKTLVKSK